MEKRRVGGQKESFSPLNESTLLDSNHSCPEVSFKTEGLTLAKNLYLMLENN
jgi:hypothetical protein